MTKSHKSKGGKTIKVQIKITDNLKSWLGVVRGERYPAEMETSQNGRYYTITNIAGKIVDVPDWAAIIHQLKD